MIHGIPYFGENTQEIIDEIRNTTDYKEIAYKSLYDAIIDNINKKIIVVIDDVWLTWLNDILFNYRDKECYIPYFTYDIFEIKEPNIYSNNKGHLILKDNSLFIRYKYTYNKFNININNLKLRCINIDTMESFIISTNSWIKDETIDFDKLYKLYVESSYKDDDFDYNKHSGGYHYIDRAPRQFKNRENELRQQYNLIAYNPAQAFDTEYRDVRNFKYNEVIQKYGMLDSIDLYRERRLRFESYLYCCIRQGLLDNLEFRKGIYKYGDTIKLIIKDYWILNKDRPNKTWRK